MLAIMGIKTANATNFSMEASNSPMTMEANMAVSKLMPSQKVRRFAVRVAGAKISSSS